MQQITPSFLDAPGSQMASFMQPDPRSSLDDSCIRQSVTIVFCSPAGGRVRSHPAVLLSKFDELFKFGLFFKSSPEI